MAAEYGRLRFVLIRAVQGYKPVKVRQNDAAPVVAAGEHHLASPLCLVRVLFSSSKGGRLLAGEGGIRLEDIDI